VVTSCGGSGTKSKPERINSAHVFATTAVAEDENWNWREKKKKASLVRPVAAVPLFGRAHNALPPATAATSTSTDRPLGHQRLTF
jgi:hypothetical protein